MDKKGYTVRHLNDVEPTACPCGSSQRIITVNDTPVAGFHITHIQDSKKHYHKNTTEIYHILEGQGVLEIGEDRIDLSPGLTVLIENEGVPFDPLAVEDPSIDDKLRQANKRRDQSPRTTSERTTAIFSSLEHHRPAIGGDDQ